jgi:hypothetical protein
MSCTQTDIDAINCRLKAIEDNQDTMWETLYSDTDPYVLFYAGDIGNGNDHAPTQALADYLNAQLEEIGNEKFLGFIACGDLAYPSNDPAYWDAGLLPFNTLIFQEKYFPVLGNHDLDGEYVAQFLSKFNYLPLNAPTVDSMKRNYYLDFRSKIGTIVFCFDTVYKTTGSTTGSPPVGILVIDPTSLPIANQKIWFYDSIDNLKDGLSSVTAVIHHPFCSVEDGPVMNRDYMPSWDLEFAENAIPFLVNGHSHNTSRITKRKDVDEHNRTEILNASAFGGVSSPRNAGDIVAPATLDYTYTERYVNDMDYMVIKMEYYKTKIVTSFIQIHDGGVGEQNNYSKHSFVSPLNQML